MRPLVKLHRKPVKFYDKVCIVVQVEKLVLAKQHGCYDVIHCDESRECSVYFTTLIIFTYFSENRSKNITFELSLHLLAN